MKQYLSIFLTLLFFSCLPSFGAGPEAKRATPGVLKSLAIGNADWAAAAELEKNNQELKQRGEHGEKSDEQLVRNALRQLSTVKDPWYCRWNQHSLGRGTVKNLYQDLVAALSTAHATQKDLIATTGVKAGRDAYAKAEKIQNWEAKAQELDSLARRLYFTPAATHSLESLIEELVAHEEYLAASYYFEGWKRKANLSQNHCDSISVGITVLGAMAASAAGRSPLAIDTLHWVEKCKQPADFIISNGRLFFAKATVPASEWHKTARDLIQQVKDTDTSLGSWFPEGPSSKKERVRRALVFSEDPSAFPELLEKYFPDIRKNATFCELYEAKHLASVEDPDALANRNEEKQLRDELERVNRGKVALDKRLAKAEQALAKHRQQAALQPADADSPENSRTLKQLRELTLKRTGEFQKEERLAAAVEDALREPAEDVILFAGDRWRPIQGGRDWVGLPQDRNWEEEKRDAILRLWGHLNLELEKLRKQDPELLELARGVAQHALNRLEEEKPERAVQLIREALNKKGRLVDPGVENQEWAERQERQSRMDKAELEEILGIPLNDEEVRKLVFIAQENATPIHSMGVLENIFNRIPQKKAVAAFNQQPLKSENPLHQYIFSIALEAFYGKSTEHKLPAGIFYELARFEEKWENEMDPGSQLAKKMIIIIRHELQKTTGVDVKKAALMDTLANLDVLNHWLQDSFKLESAKVIHDRPFYDEVVPILEKVNPERAKDLQDLFKSAAAKK